MSEDYSKMKKEDLIRKLKRRDEEVERLNSVLNSREISIREYENSLNYLAKQLSYPPGGKIPEDQYGDSLDVVQYALECIIEQAKATNEVRAYAIQLFAQAELFALTLENSDDPEGNANAIRVRQLAASVLKQINEVSGW